MPPTPKPKGRRPKLDDDMIRRICGQIKKGNTIKAACMACGIGSATYFKWKNQGEADRAATPPKATKFTAFLEELDHAEAVAQQRLVERVLRLGGWKGSLEILKRRFRDDWGDKTALMNPDGSNLQTGAGGPAINVSIRCNSGQGDDPWTWDESARPKTDGDDDQPGAAPVPAGK